MTFRASDSSSLLVDQVCGELNVPAANVEKFKTSLTENLLDTCGVLLDVSSEDWMAMRIPLRILVEARKRVDRSARPTAPLRSVSSQAPLPEPIAEPAAKPGHSRSLSNAGPRKMPPPLQKLKRQEQIGDAPAVSTSFEDLSKFIRKTAPATATGKDRKKAEASSIKRKLTKGKSGPAPRMPSTGGTRVNVIGREGHSNQLVKLALGEGAKYSSYVNCSYSQKYTIYGEPVAVEIYDAATVETIDPSILVLVFSTHSLRSLTKMTDKWMATNEAGGFDVPIVLVGLFKTTSDSGAREVSRFTAMEVCEQMNAVRYIEVTSKEEAHEVFMECGRAVLRDNKVDLAPRFVDVITKVIRAEEKQQQELGLRKRQLPLLPNAIVRTRSFLQKLRLDTNNFQFFPEELVEFTHLMELALPYNQIKEIPASISKMKSLQRLDLEGNQIEALPLVAIKKMNMLEELKLKGNPLTKLPELINKAGDILAQIKQLEKAQLEDKAELKSELPGYITPFKIFSVPLQDLMANEYKLLPNNPIPRIVRRAFAHILTYGVGQEGIFRLAGQNQKMDAMREQIDNLCTVKFAPTENCHNVTNVFKQWLRNLPEPAFQFKNFEKVLALADLPVEECLEQCKLILESLPRENYHLIRQTFRLMFLVANNSTVNRMDAGNVTKVVGPNLLYSKEVEMDPLANISQVTNMNDVLQRITENYKVMFEETVPNLFDVDYLQEKTPTAILYRKMFGHKKSVVAVQLTEDKQSLWTGDSAGILRVWDTTTLKLRHEVELGKRINAMVLAAGNMWIGLADCIQIRDQNDVTELVCEIENAPTYNLCVVNEQVWVGDAGKLIIYDVDAFMGEPVDVGALPVCLTTVGDCVWGACADRKIRVWRNDTRALVAELDAQHDGGRINSISTINGMVWSGATNGTIQVWDPEKLEVSRLLELKHEGKVFGVTRVGQQAWTYAWNGDVHVYSVSEPFEYVELLPNFHSDAIGGVAALYSEKFQCWNAMTVSWDTSVCSWLVHAGPAFP